MISCYIISYRITTWISSTTNPPGRTAFSIWHSPFVLSLWPAVQPALESATTTTSSYSEQTSKPSRTRRNPESSTCSSESRLGVRETVFEVRRRHILPEQPRCKFGWEKLEFFQRCHQRSHQQVHPKEEIIWSLQPTMDDENHQAPNQVETSSLQPSQKEQQGHRLCQLQEAAQEGPKLPQDGPLGLSEQLVRGLQWRNNKGLWRYLKGMRKDT